MIRLAQQGAKQVALGLVLLYLLLGVAASACLFEPASSAQSSHQQHRHHHSHGSGPAHSTLCAWACQVNPAQGLMSVAPQLTPQLLASFFLLLVSVLPVIRYGPPVRSRAPPR